ncbi:hypothetical protein J2755_000400 [Methanohalophilus levihalophilus]|nr:hypothetical protein [Methanohalophilus levihalophilus]MBP2029480.1 hypothetical protein [Methanohalophilus levihalophilus]
MASEKTKIRNKKGECAWFRACRKYYKAARQQDYYEGPNPSRDTDDM